MKTVSSGRITTAFLLDCLFIRSRPFGISRGDERTFCFLLQIVAALPKQWFSDQQQTTMASLEALARYLATLAASMQRSSAGCPEAERKKAR